VVVLRGPDARTERFVQSVICNVGISKGMSLFAETHYRAGVSGKAEV
jgi:hypothetical protein